MHLKIFFDKTIFIIKKNQSTMHKIIYKPP